jgi:peptidoglycan/LPS O-acetylase OafA/YrhL
VPRSPALEPPPGNPRFPFADGLRALAVLSVIFCHSGGVSGAFHTASWGWLTIYVGWAGMCVFFTLSGFLLYRPFAAAHAGLRPGPSVRAYARRRVLRIVPAYWLALTLLAIYPHVTGPFTSHWWVYYGFAQVYSVDYLSHGIGPAWSLCVEMTFYLLLPLLAVAVMRLGGRFRWWRAELAMLVPFAAIGVTGRALVAASDLPPWVANTLLSYTELFAVGMAIAVVSVAVERRGRAPARLEGAFRRSWPWWTAAALAIALAHGAFDMFHVDATRPTLPRVSDVIVCQLLFAACAAAMLVPVVLGGGGAIRRLLAARPLVFVGVVSYGMYLWHEPLLTWVANFHAAGAPTAAGPGIQHWFGGHQVTLTLMVATIALSMLAGSVSYYAVELPFLRRKEPRLRGRVTPALAKA